MGAATKSATPLLVNAPPYRVWHPEGMGTLSRKIPAAVRKQLRQEVEFGCPVPGCGNPYLEYHHFDPPWHVEPHHDPDRMIALCATHHAKADAWTVDQVREMKRGVSNGDGVGGRFEWMRDDVLAIIGNSFFYETPNMVVIGGRPAVWFERDAGRRLLLNIDLPTADGKQRTRLRNNDWLIEGEPSDVESPPNGSQLRVRYPDGDYVSVRFREWESVDALAKSLPGVRRYATFLNFPLVTAVITFKMGMRGIEFGGSGASFGGVQVGNAFVGRCQNGFVIG